jgi:hypothetical protein
MKPVNSQSSRVPARKFSRIESLESRQLLSAVSPVVTALLSPAAVGVEGVALAGSFGSVNRLERPNPEAQSYLNLTAYSPFDVDFDTLQATLSSAPMQAQILAGEAAPLTIAIPNPDGGYSRFAIYQSETMAPKLAAQYPEITTFAGQGIDDPTATLAMDCTPQGFHAAVNGASGRYYIDPYYHLNAEAGEVAYWTDDNLGNGSFQCLQEDPLELEPESAPTIESSDLVSGTSWLGATLRTYRLAIGATAEYTAFHGGTVTLGLAAVTTSVVRLNQIYEADYAIRMTLVANENLLIYTNASTDPYGTPTDPDITNADNQATLDSVIGSGNYDMGHVYYRTSSSNDNNGLAGGIGTVGTAGIKGEGYTAYTSPVNDNFVIDFVAHEMGHQFGGRHNFNSAGGGPGDAYSLGNELGSGQSIMAYAGLGTTQENVLLHSIAQFNANNYVVNSSNVATQILQYTLTSTSTNGYLSAVKTATGNTPPSVSVDASNFNIPLSTPFALTATGSDANGDTLTYSWEQMDGSSSGSTVTLSTVGGIVSVPNAASTNGPAFRVYPATTNPTRTFPVLSAILAGRTYNGGEQLPSVARTLRFAVVARDNRAGGGGVAIGRMTVTTIAGSAFSLTSFNSSTSVNGGSSQTINWTNTLTGSGTTINAATVNILLSTDGGNTFPITLASNVANDGSEAVTMPYNLGTSTARIKIVPTNNVFFDINNANFTINFASNTSATPSAPILFTSSDTGVSNSDGITKLNNSSAGSTLQFSVGNTVSGALVEILSDGVVIGSATASGTFTTVATDGTSVLTDSSHTITARQTESGKSASPNSGSMSITVDATAPTLSSQAFVYETSPIRTTFTFNEAVAVSATGPSMNDSLMNLTTSTAAPSTFSAAGNTATLAAMGILTDGNYRATLLSAALTDIAGNSPAADAVQDFFFLNADANRDRFVDTQDFNLLAANFGGSSKIFSEGNFDYDAAGNVDSVDFDLFVAKYGTRLAAPAAPMPAQSLFAGSIEYSPERLEL